MSEGESNPLDDTESNAGSPPRLCHSVTNGNFAQPARCDVHFENLFFECAALDAGDRAITSQSDMAAHQHSHLIARQICRIGNAWLQHEIASASCGSR